MQKTKNIYVYIAVLSMGCSTASKQQLGYSGLGSVSVSPDQIVKFAPPALDYETSSKIQRLLDVRSPGAGIYDPAFKRLFFSWKVTGVRQVWRLDSPKSFPIQMTGGEDATVVTDVAPNGKFIILSRDEAGKENPGIYLQNALGGELVKIQHLPNIRTTSQFITNNSESVYFKSNDREPDSFALYRYDFKTKNKELIFSEKGIWSIADHQENKNGNVTHLLLERAKTNTSSEFFDYDLATQIKIPVIGNDDEEEYSVSYGTNQNQYFVLTPKLGEFRKLYSFKDKKLTPITKELKWDISGFHVDDEMKRLYYTVNEGGYTKAFAIDAKTFKEVALPNFGKADHISPGTTTRDGRYVVFAVEKSKSPVTSYLYDWSKRSLVQWVVPSAPEVNLEKFAEAELQNIDLRNGSKIPAFVRYPENCKDIKNLCPVVVHFHGGPEAQSTAGFDLYAQMLVDEGFIFVEPNVRGSDGYGKTWLHSDNGSKRLQVLSDIEDVSVYLKKSRSFNGRTPKVGVMGWSYGGYSTFIAMTKYAGSFDAGVAMVGMSDLYTFLMNTAPYRRALRIPEYGDPEKDREALRELSAINYIDQIRDPLLIIQGVNDPRVPAGEAIQMHKKLTEKNIPAELILFADEGHGASKRPNQVLEVGNFIRFFKRHLK